MIDYQAEAREIRAQMEKGERPQSRGNVDITAMSPEDALAFLNGVRPELEAITAVFCHMLMNHTEQYREGFPPYGLAHEESGSSDGKDEARVLKPVDSITSLQQLGGAMFETLQAARTDFFETYKGKNDHFTDWYDEADLLLGYFRAAPIHLMGNYDSPEAFIDGGIGTAVDVSVRTLDLVDRAHERFAPDAALEEIDETGRRAKRLPYKLGMTVPVESLREALNALGGVRWSSESDAAKAFSMDRVNVTPDTKNPNVLNIKFGSDALSDPAHEGRKLEDKETMLSLVRCPGMVEFQDGQSPFTHVGDRVYLNMLGLARAFKLWRSGIRLGQSEVFDV